MKRLRQTDLKQRMHSFCCLQRKRKIFLLAILLTADAATATQCIEMAREDCLSGHSVCKGWARTWARHVVVKHAITILAKHYGSLAAMPGDAKVTPVDLSSSDFFKKEFAEYTGLLALSNLDRIVFVLCVLEEYSTYECALLLGKSQRDVIEAQSLATKQIVEFRREIMTRETNRHDSIPSSEGTNQESDTPREWIRSFGCLSKGDGRQRLSISADRDSCRTLLG